MLKNTKLAKENTPGLIKFFILSYSDARLIFGIDDPSYKKAKFTHQSLPAILGRQWNVDPLFESSSQGLVDVPREVSGRQYHDDLARFVVGACHAIHLIYRKIEHNTLKNECHCWITETYSNI
jgi:hypothetical protein